MIKQLMRLWLPLVILALLTAVSFLLFAIAEPASWLSNLTLSLGSAFLSIVVTVLLIDSYLSAKDAQDRLKTQQACLRSLKIPLVRLSDVLFHMVKATSEHREEDGERSVAEFLREIDARRIALLDSARPAPVTPRRTWESYIIEAFSGFTRSLEAFVEKYAVHLDAHTIDVCEKLVGHQFLALMSHVPTLRSVQREEGLPDLVFPLLAIAAMETEGDSALNDYLGRLRELVDLVGSASGGDALTHHQHWRDDVEPAVGSGISAQQGAAADGFAAAER